MFYCGDCNVIMKTEIEESSIDVIVTSPPYNNGTPYNGYNDKNNDYYDMMEQFAGNCCDVLKTNGSLFLNLGNNNNTKVLSYFLKYFDLQNTICWIKHISIPEHDISLGHFKPINSKRYMNRCFEYIYHFTHRGDVSIDKLAIGVPYKDKSNINRFNHATNCRDRGDVWFIPYDTRNKQHVHPATFPVKLPEMCIKLHGYDNNTVVFDPFMGSGSTIQAAKNLGCKYIGCDVSQVYVDYVVNQ